MKILGTGLTGLVGSRIVELLETKHEFETSSSKNGCNIVDGLAIDKVIASSQASVVLHFAAKTNVDGCELDKEYDQQYKTVDRPQGNHSAWEVNVIGTRNIVEACKKAGKKLVYVSTDFVFDGEKSEGYSEEDVPYPINWYGLTKFTGEKIAQNYLDNALVVRIAYPYRSGSKKNGFAETIFKKLKNNEHVLAVTDHTMTPTFVDDIAHAIDTLIEKNAQGIFHVVGSEFITPYAVSETIAKKFNFDTSLIKKTTRAEYFKNGAPRPFQLAMRNDKIKKLGISMLSFQDGLGRLNFNL